MSSMGGFLVRVARHAFLKHLTAIRASNFGIDLEKVAFRIGKVHGSMPPRLVIRRIKDCHALGNEFVVALIDLCRRNLKSEL